MDEWICTGFDHNPDYGIKPGAPLLIRCQQLATYKLLVDDGIAIKARRCCGYHATELRHRARRGRMEILSDEPIE